MGQRISSSGFSCMDCDCRLITIEDNESSSRVKNQDSTPEGSEDLNDEITVFESPVKIGSKQDFYESQENFYQQDSVLTTDIMISPNAAFSEKRLYMKNRITKLNTSHTILKNDDSLLSGHSNSDISFVGFSSNSNAISYKYIGNNSPGITSIRCKMYSSNVSPVSINLVDSIRKCSSVRSENTLDGMGIPRNS
ncbi:hypothetical protein SteCoe_13539 [Stentor coeruleus]|uniref:Uncharacterized protein n=1 Tax=Stentor coeruleus TaxID=5963 RepID=A0A1R2C887_9CILI|nr:hypothetical protein SteCoe_13539 [Stentor coeruleus]